MHLCASAVCMSPLATVVKVGPIKPQAVARQHGKCASQVQPNALLLEVQNSRSDRCTKGSCGSDTQILGPDQLLMESCPRTVAVNLKPLNSSWTKGI